MTKQRNHSSQEKINVALLGATGIVGQVFIHLLSNHHRFDLAVIVGSAARAGKQYQSQVQWALPFPLPERLASKTLDCIDINRLKEENVKIVFSALPTDVAKTIEPELRDNGFYVFSNASALRYDSNVPILIPEANPESLKLIEDQGYPESGFVVTNANCSTTGLAVALAPLKPFGIREVFVSTYQSISGAGYPGLPALDIMNNAIPYIAKEEEKMIEEVEKILQLNAAIFPHCVRIPVPFGHLETVWLTFDRDVSEGEVLEAWKNFKGVGGTGSTHPSQPVQYMEEESHPRPGHSFWGEPAGQQVFTGRLRNVGGKTGFSLLVNNLVKGAAGGSVQNAELFIDTYGTDAR